METELEIKPEHRGLEGIVAATTSLSKVEGLNGRLIYRGYNIHDLVANVAFEEVCYLLWYGHLPNHTDLEALKLRLASERALPQLVLNTLTGLSSNTEPINALQSAVLAWGKEFSNKKPDINQAIAITASFPLFLTAFHRIRQKLPIVPPRADLGQAANFLYMLHGREASPEQVKALDSYMILLADHGMNASTFTARIITSTGSDMASAISAALGALKGPLHGGAPSKVQDMLEAIGQADQVEIWLKNALAQGERLMGFGHRIYKTTDPRAEELGELARMADPVKFKLARQVEETALTLLEQAKPGRRLYTNVEFYSAVLLASVGLPSDLFTATFAASRVAGLTAHILEQGNNNRLIRPEAEYIGPPNREFVKIA